MPVTEEQLRALDSEPSVAPVSAADIAKLDEEDELEKDATVYSLMQPAAKDLDRRAAVKRLADQVQARPQVVDQNFDSMKQAYELSQFDPRKFRKEYGAFANLLLEDPEVGSIAIVDKPLKALEHLRKWLGVPAPLSSVENAPPMTRESLAAAGALPLAEKQAIAEAGTEEQSAVDAAEAAKPPERVAMRVDPTAKAARAQAYLASTMRAAKSTEYADLGFQMMRDRNAGKDTWQQELRQLELERELEPRYYGETNGLDAAIFSATEIAPSLWETIKAGGVGGAAGAVVGGVVGGVAGSLAGGAGAIPGAKAGAMTGLSIGSRGGSSLRSFVMVTGASYLEYSKLPGVDHQTANGMAVLNGVVASAIEAATFGVDLKMFGPAGEAIAAGQGAKFMASALKDKTAAEMLKSIGRAYAKGVSVESLEEGAQDLVNDFFAYMAKTVATGEAAKPDIAGSIASATETVLKTGAGMGVLAMGPSGVNLVTKVNAMGQAKRAGETIALVRGVMKDSPTVKASPPFVAKMIEQATAESGDPVTHLYVDTNAFVQYFQSGNGDPKKAAEELLGEGGALHLQRAIATGQKLEVSLPLYLEKWGATTAGEALAADTTTKQGFETPRALDGMQADIEAQAKVIAEEYSKANLGDETTKDAPKDSKEYSALKPLIDQLIATGMSEQDALQQEAMNLAVRTTFAKKMGKTLEEFDRGFVTEVRREGQPTTTPVSSASTVVLHQEALRQSGSEAIAKALYLDETGSRTFDAFDLAPVAGAKVGMITIPDQKAVNDSPVGGHITGDQLLQQIAAAIGGDVARDGTNFAVHVADQAGLDAVLARVKAALPDQRIEVRGFLGNTREEAGEGLGKAVDAERGKTLPERGGSGLGANADEIDASVKGLQFKPGKAAASITPEMVAAAGKLTADELAATYRDKVVPGLWSKRGWNALPRRAHVAAGDLKGLRTTNLEYGKGSGNELLRKYMVMASVLAKQMGVDAAHISGDEFAFQHDDPVVLQAYIDTLTRRVKNIQVKATSLSTGRVGFVRGGFHHGFGDTYGLADRDLNARKRKRAVAGGGSDPGGSGPLEAGGTGADAGGRGAADVAGDGSLGEAGAPAAVEDTSFDTAAFDQEATVEAFDPQYSAKQLEDARAWIAARKDGPKKTYAAAYLKYALGETGDRPKVKPGADEKVAAVVISELAKFGIEDPDGGTIREYQNIDAGMRRAKIKGRGEEPKDLRDGRTGKNPGYYEQPGRKQIETPEFKAWFKDSKVVGPEGKPIAVYHGTGSAGFEAFAKEFQDPNALMGPGFYFTENPAIASEYVDKSARLSGNKGETPAVYPVFLSIARPFDASEANAGQLVAQLQKFKAKVPPPDVKRMIDGALRDGPDNFTLSGIGGWVDSTEWSYNITEKAGMNGEEYLKPHADYLLAKARDYIVKQIRGREMWSAADVLNFIDKNVSLDLATFDNANIRHVLEKLGYDGITHEGGGRWNPDGDKHKVWIAFEPGQVKSAIGNRGTFDPNDPNILHQGDKANPRGDVLMGDAAGKRLYRIMLKKGADPSTIVHEFGHVYLDMMEQLAGQSNAPPGIKTELAAARAWLGVKDGEAIQVEHHEKWARAWEAYLFTGKAPTPELVAPFVRFRRWLTSVYGSIKSLIGEDDLDPFIRGIFDRLLATDEEIARVTRSMGPPTFRSPQEAGMTGEQWQTYLAERELATTRAQESVTKRILQDLKREAEGWWKQEEKALRVAAGKEYDAQPAARAWRQLKNGEMTDDKGAVILNGVNIRLDKDAVEAAIGPRAAKTFTGILVSKDGEHPDGIAGQFGFTTGKALLEAIVALPDRDDFAKEKAAEAMKVKHPGLLEEREKLTEAVANGLHGENSSAHLLREWALLRQKAFVMVENPEANKQQAIPRERLGQKPPPIESIKLAAKQLVDKQPVGKLKVEASLAAERSSAEKTAVAAANGDWKAAYVFKQQQLLNHYLYKELTGAREVRDRLRDITAKANDTKSRSKVGKASGTLLSVSDQVLVSLGLRPAEEDATPASMDQAIEVFSSVGLEPVFDVDVLRRVLARPLPMGELTVAEAREVDKAMRQIRKVANDINHVTIDGQRAATASVAITVASEAKAKLSDLGPLQGSPSARKWRQAAASTLNGLRAAQLDPEALIGRLGSTATRFFWDKYISSRNAEDTLARKVLAFFEQHWDKLPKEMQNRRYDLVDGAAEALPMPGDVNLTWPYDRQFLWMVALNTGNSSNMKRLLGGYGWDEHQVRGVLNKHLTKEEWEFIQGVWDMMDEQLYPEVKRAYREANGIDPDKIEPVAFVTPHGVFRGGYFPARYSPVASRLGTQQAESRIDQLYAGSGARASVARSFTKSRAESYSDVVQLDWAVVPSHVADVVHYVSFDAAVRDMARMLDRPETVTAIQRHLGEEYRTQLDDWLKVVASGNADPVPKAIRAVAGVIQAFGGRTVAAALYWNWVNATADLTNPLLAIAAGDVKARYVAVAVASVAKQFVADRGDLGTYRERSAELSHRANEGAKRLRQQLGEVGGAGRSGRIRRVVDRTGFFFQEAAGKLTDTIVWEAAYREGSASGLNVAESVKFADGKVRGIAPSQDSAEQPALLRNKAALGGMVVMHGFFSKVGNIIDRKLADPLNALIDAEGAAGKARAALDLAPAVGRVLAVIFVYSVLGELASARGPDDGEEIEDWLKRKMIEGAFMPIPVVGGAMGETIGRSVVSGELTVRSGSFRASPLVGGVERFLKALAKAADDDKDGDERIFALLQAVGFGAKMPVTQPKRTGGYLYDVATGEEKPVGVVDFVGGVWRGKREGQPMGPADLLEELAE